MSTTTVAQPAYQIREGNSSFGAPTMRAFDTATHQPIAAAIQSSEGWIMFAYHGAAANLPDGAVPRASLTARTDDDARQWLEFIAALYVSASDSLAGAA